MMPFPRYLREIVVVLAAMGTAMAGPPELAVAYTTYRLPLLPYAPTPGRVEGVMLTAQVNDGPPLRLLVDTGAEDIVISQKAATRSGLEASTERYMVCAGGAPQSLLREAIAHTLAIGPVSFRNHLVLVTSSKFRDGLDGVIPISVFRGFLMSLDFRGKTIELTPYPDEKMPATEGFVPVVLTNAVLLTQARLNGGDPGYVLIDTGSAFTAVSQTTARPWISRLDPPIGVLSADGRLQAARPLASTVSFEIAGRQLRADKVVALDLKTISRFNDVDVTGVLGYPDLRKKVLTVSFRDSLVKIADQK